MSTSPSDPVRNELNETRSRLGLVKEQHEEWEFDTQVRQHNHVGLVRRFRSYHLRDLMADIVFNWWQIHSLLLNMAKEGKLAPQIEAAKEKMAEKKAKANSGNVMDE